MMKNLKIAALLLFATATISAQDLKTDEVPTNLQTIFSNSYSNVADVEWEKKGDHYKVEFEVNSLEHDIWYDADGNVAKSKVEILESELPSAVASAVKTKYADYKVDSVEVHEEGGKTTYEVEIEKGWTKERKLIVDASGKILSDIED
ncbi:PepSY domain-containing protein [Gelidibacter maritimus]|uniref:PepSY-like domain-containing protein n=1 Tax=Gelidibacter maritimus TaxID=2761487 RepID=A0A7W2M8H1_9FLAO|nr:PepSY-like domain-containing protein [Gelidibacter maritimus]MBA6154476.1 PepSY-like domain-containing protein [Gelidibacter maritimus]